MSPILFISFMDRILNRAPREDSVWFTKVRDSSLLLHMM